ncbi:MAG: collagen-like protein [Solirubrobacterales bacterium]|nr:collagen-like protein [Solirubrobacterales bacterium]
MRRRLSDPALLVAILALAVACTGTAGAAVKYVISKSSQVKDGSLTGADVKNRSLTGADVKDGTIKPQDLNTSILEGLRRTGAPGIPGSPGTAGIPGVNGANGASGADGSNGSNGTDGPSGKDGSIGGQVVTAHRENSDATKILATKAPGTSVATVDLPSGSWLVLAGVSLDNGARFKAETVTCSLHAADREHRAFTSIDTGDRDERTRALQLHLGVTLTSAAKATLGCWTLDGRAVSAYLPSITALRVAGVEER